VWVKEFGKLKAESGLKLHGFASNSGVCDAKVSIYRLDSSLRVDCPPRDGVNVSRLEVQLIEKSVRVRTRFARRTSNNGPRSGEDFKFDMERSLPRRWMPSRANEEGLARTKERVTGEIPIRTHCS
jgi:hypothetical protein